MATKQIKWKCPVCKHEHTWRGNAEDCGDGETLLPCFDCGNEFSFRLVGAKFKQNMGVPPKKIMLGT
jgi:hypothetical protein